MVRIIKNSRACVCPNPVWIRMETCKTTPTNRPTVARAQVAKGRYNKRRGEERWTLCSCTRRASRNECNCISLPHQTEGGATSSSEGLRGRSASAADQLRRVEAQVHDRGQELRDSETAHEKGYVLGTLFGKNAVGYVYQELVSVLHSVWKGLSGDIPRAGSFRGRCQASSSPIYLVCSLSLHS